MTNYSTYNSRNIFEYFTSTKAVFLCLDALDFMDGKGTSDPKMKIRFAVHDDSLNEGQRITQEISTYIPIGKFLVFAHDVLNGTMIKKKRMAFQSGESTYRCYFEHYGGSRADTVISTKFSLVDGRREKASFAFLMTSCPGTLTSKGGIVPVGADESVQGQTKNASRSIFINIPDDKLKEFCLIGQAYIEQYISMDLQTRMASIRNQRRLYQEAKQMK